jgi:hypothetical protein
MAIIKIQSTWLTIGGTFKIYLLKNGVVQNIGGTTLTHVANWFYTADVPVVITGTYDVLVTEGVVPILESILYDGSLEVGKPPTEGTLAKQVEILDNLTTLSSSITSATPEIYNVFNYDTDFQPLADVRCHLTHDARGLSKATEVIYSNTTGFATFFVREGDYYLWRYHPSMEYKNPVLVSVPAN